MSLFHIIYSYCLKYNLIVIYLNLRYRKHLKCTFGPHRWRHAPSSAIRIVSRPIRVRLPSRTSCVFRMRNTNRWTTQNVARASFFTCSCTSTKTAPERRIYELLRLYKPEDLTISLKLIPILKILSNFLVADFLLLVFFMIT